MYEIKDVTEHKTMKGVKGFIYKCLWVNSEPTWEPESHIKPTADKLLNQYWRQATKSCKPEPSVNTNSANTTPLKQSLLSTKRIVAERKHEQAIVIPEQLPNSALTVLQIT